MIHNRPNYSQTKCYLVTENGFHSLYSQSGELIGGQILSHTTDHLNYPQTCTAEFLVNICTKEEMEQDIIRKGAIVSLTIGDKVLKPFDYDFDGRTIRLKEGVL